MSSGFKDKEEGGGKEKYFLCACVFLSQTRALFRVDIELLMDYFGDLGIQNAASLV